MRIFTKSIAISCSSCLHLKYYLFKFLVSFSEIEFSWLSRGFVRKLLLHCIRFHPPTNLLCLAKFSSILHYNAPTIQRRPICTSTAMEKNLYSSTTIQRYLCSVLVLPEDLVDSVFAKSLIAFFVWIGFDKIFISYIFCWNLQFWINYSLYIRGFWEKEFHLRWSYLEVESLSVGWGAMCLKTQIWNIFMRSCFLSSSNRNVLIMEDILSFQIRSDWV